MNCISTALLLIILVGSNSLIAAGDAPASTTNVIEYWSVKERRDKATARDLFINELGEGFVKQKLHKDDSGEGALFRLKPRGQLKNAQEKANDVRARQLQEPQDVVTLLAPNDGWSMMSSTVSFEMSILGFDQFSNLDLVIQDPSGNVTHVTVQASPTEDGVVNEVLGGFEELGTWSWYVSATHIVTGEVVETGRREFTREEEVRHPIGRQEIIPEDSYPHGGSIKDAVGYLYFEFPSEEYPDEWDGYVCSGTAIYDNKSDRSLILTAAHCIYDQFTGSFARNILFVPNQDATTGVAFDFDCDNDPCGCWIASGGVVFDEYAGTSTSLEYDYGFLVVSNSLSHFGPECRGSEALDEAVDVMKVSVNGNNEGDTLNAFGYLYDPPDLLYCRDEAVIDGDGLYLPGCTLGAGASGGPLVKNLDTESGVGEVIGINAWSFVDAPGLGGPILGSATRCLANTARETDLYDIENEDDGRRGVKAICFDRPCVPSAGQRRLRGGLATVPCGAHQ